MENLEKPTMSNTKKEILEAYDELMKRKLETETKHPKEEKAEKQKADTIRAASELSAEGIVKGLATIKLDIAAAIDKIEEGLLKEFQKLNKLQGAIQLETDNLEDLYGIRANADSLAVLIAANREKKTEFETEMKLKKDDFESNQQVQKQEWTKEQKERNERWKEEDELRKKTLKREEEEYKYNLSTTRKKEEDTYLSKKETQERELAEKRLTAEKELSEREKVIVEKESELENLVKQVSEFPKVLEKEVAQAQKAVEEQLTTKHKYERDIFERETQGENRLLQQTITSLEAKIKEQEALIANLNAKTDTAGQQVQTIALKALESASALRQREKSKERETEDN